MPSTLKIKGDAEVKIEFLGHVYFDENTPFEFDVPLHESGSVSHSFGPAEVTVGVDGDSASVGVSVEGFPVFAKSISLSELESNPVPFDVDFLGDQVKGTISDVAA